MAVLTIDVTSNGVVARATGPDDDLLATGTAGLSPLVDGARAELRPDDLWRAVLAATEDATSGGLLLTAVSVAGETDTAVLWDLETLGAPRDALLAADHRADAVCTRLAATATADRVAALTGQVVAPSRLAPRLTWLAEHEPHTWALVEAGRYGVGSLASYVAARMSRGTYHVAGETDAARSLLLDTTTGRWSEELCGLFGVPLDALPDVVPDGERAAVSEARTFLGWSLPVRLGSPSSPKG